ncbi:Zn-ribbon domain-containing OB-fold protein [Pseudonocardia ailaonensis]|uniref:Zn-ribbon domain-containing OB-fold protein n=1 Tax=Pseudonocardia ailaonensis TaxID=367279 RepID=A0ABN2NJ02_9PSEU
MNAEHPERPDEDPWDVFQEGARRGELLLRECGDCGARSWPVPWMQRCHRCLGADTRWLVAGGTGTLYTFARIHQDYHPSIADRTPYPIGIVDLAEGARTGRVGLLVEPGATLRAGSPVAAEFREAPDGSTIPWFVVR